MRRVSRIASESYAARSTPIITPMLCYVYKSRLRPDTYVYLAEKDGFQALPEALRQRLGELQTVLELELTPQRRLAQADAATVLRDLAERGFYIQLPPPPEVQA